ncbi:LacI family transcriptional regulator [Devosia yakushimensis]|uniref:LacI family transcriptional regulator n=1 Tax=Devosia yakushimensis TaxID=470028 RepID=A0ABQ5UG54_9HYPH|nr:LacI family DNA-binding transcriptional regulator [Devosia yakushimensis]GLQ10633.1 LacI family transcriptional regulator [Devosia yakushimensis]
MARVTIQSIADQLGLSKFAVSRALSGHSGVSDATRAAVVEMAARLGYIARNKASTQTKIEIIYHAPEIMHRELWIEVQAGAQARAPTDNVSTTVRLTNDPAAVEQLASSADGFLLIGPHEDSMLDAIRESGLPCVRIGGPLPPLDVMDHVGGVDEEGAAAVARHLLDLGHRHFVYVHGQAGYPGRVLRFESFRSQLAEVSGTKIHELVLPQDNAPTDFSGALSRLHQEGFRPTGYFCGNDYVAVTVLTELMRLGIRVPEEASVVGYGGYAIASHTSPMLTTVEVPYRQIGRMAMSLLLSRIGTDGAVNNLPPQRVGLVPQLVVNGTTAPKRA